MPLLLGFASSVHLLSVSVEIMLQMKTNAETQIF